MKLSVISPKLPGPVGGGALSVFGAFGTILDVKHAGAAIGQTFAGCTGPIDFLWRLVGLDDTLFFGMLVWLGILVASVTALFIGLRALYHHYATDSGDVSGGNQSQD